MDTERGSIISAALQNPRFLVAPVAGGVTTALSISHGITRLNRDFFGNVIGDHLGNAGWSQLGVWGLIGAGYLANSYLLPEKIKSSRVPSTAFLILVPLLVISGQFIQEWVIMSDHSEFIGDMAVGTLNAIIAAVSLAPANQE